MHITDVSNLKLVAAENIFIRLGIHSISLA